MSNRPDPLYMSATHWDCFDELASHLCAGRGHAWLSACAGVGRSTFVQRVMRRLHRDMPIAMVDMRTNNTVGAFAQATVQAFGLQKTPVPANDLPPPNDNEAENILLRLCEEAAKQSQRITLIIDNAAHITHELSAFLTNLTSFRSCIDHVAGSSTSLQLVFIDGPRGKRMVRQALQQNSLSPSEVMPWREFTLAPFTADDTAAYVRLRLGAAFATTLSAHAPDDAMLALHTYSGGLIKKLRVLVNYALLHMQTQQTYILEKPLVDQALRDACEGDAQFSKMPKDYFINTVKRKKNQPQRWWQRAWQWICDHMPAATNTPPSDPR